MNASTFLQWFITYELTRNQWWSSIINAFFSNPQNSNVLIGLPLFPFQYDNVPGLCFQFRQVLSLTKSRYRKTYIPHTELKTRTSLQYHYSWNTCESDLAVPVEPAKTKNPITKAKTKLPAKSPCLLIVSQHASKVDQLTDPTSFSTCMMNASTFLQWFITYEITRNQWSHTSTLQGTTNKYLQ